MYYVVDAEGACERKKQSVEQGGGSWAGEEVVACFKFSLVPRGEVDGRGQNSNSVSCCECPVCVLVWWQVVDRPLSGIFAAPKHLLARPVIGPEQG